MDHTCQPHSITALWLVLISRPAEGRRLSWPGWLGEILRWFVRRRRSPIPVLTGPDVQQLRWYAQRRYHYATPPWRRLKDGKTELAKHGAKSCNAVNVVIKVNFAVLVTVALDKRRECWVADSHSWAHTRAHLSTYLEISIIILPQHIKIGNITHFPIQTVTIQSSIAKSKSDIYICKKTAVYTHC